ncbi:FAD-binding protein [bacterium]|nr:FAD-binding protein [bacterium]
MDSQKSITKLTWFGTGGCADFFCEPQGDNAFSEALIWAKKNNLVVHVLGSGANTLANDAGIRGLLIKPAIKNIDIVKTGEVTAGCGVTIEELIKATLDAGLTGFEVFSGIPGTVGGSVFVNLHYFEAFLGNFLTSAKVISRKTGKTQTVERAWFNFGYDQSKLYEGNYFVVDATFRLNPASSEEVSYSRGRRFEIIRHRNSRYPKARTCGSFFRNFLPEELQSKQLPYIAYYLDVLGIKGKLRVGSAQVSSRHANMIEVDETKDAKSKDVIDLAKLMQELVYKEFGLLPQPECQFLGYEDFPLHTKKSIASIITTRKETSSGAQKETSRRK